MSQGTDTTVVVMTIICIGMIAGVMFLGVVAQANYLGSQHAKQQMQHSTQPGGQS